MGRSVNDTAPEFLNECLLVTPERLEMVRYEMDYSATTERFVIWEVRRNIVAHIPDHEVAEQLLTGLRSGKEVHYKEELGDVVEVTVP